MAKDYSSKTVSFTCDGFKEALDTATEETIGDVKAAIRSAMNIVIKSVKTLTSAEIRQIYNVPKKVLDDRLSVFAAAKNDLEATLIVGGRSISLSYFGMIANKGNSRTTVSIAQTKRGIRGKAKTTMMKRNKGEQGISIEIVRGRRTTLKNSAFVAVMKSGHIGIMHRGPGVIKSRAGYKGEKYKQAIYENSVVSIATMFQRANVNAAVVAKIEADLEAKFWHELGFYLDRSSR